MLLGPLLSLLVGLVSGSCSVLAGTLDTTVGLKPVQDQTDDDYSSSSRGGSGGIFFGRR